MFTGTGSLTNTQFMLERGLDAAVLRQSVISDNIANVDTPHFKRSEVTFESQLARAIDSHKDVKYPAKLTNKRHIAFYQPIDYHQVRANISIEHGTNFRNDKNNVDIEKEVIDSSKNVMRYKAMINRINGNFRKLKIVLR